MYGWITQCNTASAGEWRPVCVSFIPLLLGDLEQLRTEPVQKAPAVSRRYRLLAWNDPTAVCCETQLDIRRTVM